MVNAGKNASLLRQAHENLAQGQAEESKMLLTRLIENQPEPPPEIEYLLAWIAAEQNDWEEVGKLTNAPLFVQKALDTEDWLTATSVRRRRPGYFLRLALAARTLGYPQEAITHSQHGLKLLDERRMNIPEVRLQIHIMLGMLAIDTGDTDQAILQYETALELCGQDPTNPLLAAIDEGLCEAYLQQKLFSQALEYGKQGLLISDNACKGERKEHLLLLLSRCSSALHDIDQAHTWIRQARNLANDSGIAERIARTLLAQAELLFEEGNWHAARQNCEQASTSAHDTLSQGQIALLRGKIAEAEWSADPEKSSDLADEAMTFYEQAQSIFTNSDIPIAKTHIVEVSVHQARLLENRGQTNEALTFWKTAYELGSNRNFSYSNE